MKKNIVLILMMFACSAASAQVMEFLDTMGLPRPVSEGWPMPVKFASGSVSITIGSSTFTFSPTFADESGSGTLALVDANRKILISTASDTVDTGSQSVILLSSSDYSIPTFARRKFILLSASGTFEYTVGSTTVPANTDPCYNASFECGPNMPAAVKTTATNTLLTIRHFGR